MTHGEMREQIFICQACGRTAESRDKMSDSSCRTWAVLCWAKSIKRDADGRIVGAEAVK